MDADRAGIEQIDLHRHGHWSIDAIHFDQLCAIHWISLYFSEELNPFIETYTQPPTSVKPKQKLALILTLLAVLGGIGSYLLQDAVGIVLSVAAFFLSMIWYGLLQLRQYFANKQPQQFERTFVISSYSPCIYAIMRWSGCTSVIRTVPKTALSKLPIVKHRRYGKKKHKSRANSPNSTCTER